MITGIVGIVIKSSLPGGTDLATFTLQPHDIKLHAFTQNLKVMFVFNTL